MKFNFIQALLTLNLYSIFFSPVVLASPCCNVQCSVTDTLINETQHVELEPNSSQWYWHKTVTLTRNKGPSIQIGFKSLYVDFFDYSNGKERSHIEYDVSYKTESNDLLPNDEHLNQVFNAILVRGIFKEEGSMFLPKDDIIITCKIRK